MTEIIYQIGDVFRDSESNMFRVLSCRGNVTTVCSMNPNERLKFQYLNNDYMVHMLDTKQFTKVPEESEVFDIETLSEHSRERFRKYKEMMNDIVSEYGSDYSQLCSKRPKPELKKIQDRYQVSKSTMFRLIKKYLQSGMKDISLVKRTAFGINAGKEYKQRKKSGRKPEHFLATGIIRDSDVLRNFNEALTEYKSGRQKTYRTAYDFMNNMHYTMTVLKDGKVERTLYPNYKRPTFRQFTYYLQKHLTKEEKDIIKTSKQEQRNDKRLLLSDSLSGVAGPGDLVEIDECEADISLISGEDSSRTVGRPVVYFMVDVFSRAIIAVSVSFDNNSALGITSLFLNLADDKREYCKKYGIHLEDDAMWPSGIIPKTIRTDRGAEYKGKEFTRICNELGIVKQLVTGGTGSLKGNVEQMFHQMHLRLNVHMEDKGLIEKRYDSNHHREAVLDITHYTKAVINFVLEHNQRYISSYPLSKEMMQTKVNPIPCELWKYGIRKYGLPKPIPEINQFCFNLMTPIKAKISREGISYKDLWYLPSTEEENLKMYEAGRTKQPFDGRMDMRDVGRIYYVRNNKLCRAELNTMKHGNADFSGMTMSEYEHLRQALKKRNAEGKVYNEALNSYEYEVLNSIVSQKERSSPANKENLRENREKEKQKISSQNSISSRLQLESNEKNAASEDKKKEAEADTNLRKEADKNATSNLAGEPPTMQDWAEIIRKTKRQQS